MKHLPILALIFLSSLSVYAQKQLKGKITDENGEALFNATIREKGTNNGTMSGADGSYSLTYGKDDAVISVSYVGYQILEMKAEGKTEMDFKLALNNILTAVEIVGTRKLNRSLAESPVPVDIIDVKQIGGNMTSTTQLMQNAAPSLNCNKQSGADGADHIDLATLRGLGPDQTLVLINGKRRHQTAFVALFGTRGRGNSGTDLSAIPVSAIDHIEILRDGASAQYGSDAIAGVINIVLKKNTGEFTGDFGYGGYSDKKYNALNNDAKGQYEEGKKFDGNTLNFGGNYGVAIGKKGGALNFSIDYKSREKTFRQADSTKFLTDDNALPINMVRRGNGDASMSSYGLFLNSDIPINDKMSFYAFGGVNSSQSDAFAFSRNYSWNPERFPVDASGNMIFVDGIMHNTPDTLDVWYNPHIQTNIFDGSLALGLKGKMSNNWNWDFSNAAGNNTFHFYGDKTFNASLGSTKTNFDDGGFSFMQNTSNLNMSKELSKTLNLAVGAEVRMENYKLFAGEKDSYTNYDTTGLQATGSQGFPGYQPGDEVNAKRSVIGVYVDAEKDLTKKFLVTLAIRGENYSDFGFTSNYKLATRFKASDKFSLRASGSTGFRAPSLQQMNFSSTFTTVQGSQTSEVKIAPNYSTLAKAAGIPELMQENSVNLGMGFTVSPMKNFNVTVDAYQVQVKNRVVLSGQFDASDTTLNADLVAEMNKLKVGYAQFFVNAVNTTNRGVDVVLSYKRASEKNIFRISVLGNIQEMTIDKINVPEKLNNTPEHKQTFLSDREQAFILASAPTQKFIINIEDEIKKFTIGTRATYYGKVTLLGYGENFDGISPTGEVTPMVPTDIDPTIKVADKYVYGGKMVNDLYISYKIRKAATLTVGVNNMLNVHPDFGAVGGAKYYAYNTETGGPWDAVQMGTNGTFFYARLGFKF